MGDDREVPRINEETLSIIFFFSYVKYYKMIFWVFLAMVCWYAAAAAKSLQSCPTLCDPIDRSPSGSAVPGILQARTLEWALVRRQGSQVSMLVARGSASWLSR